MVSGKLSPRCLKTFKSGLIEQTARTIQQQGGVNLSVILDGLSAPPQKFIDDITASAAGMLDRRSDISSAGGGKDHCAAGGAAHHCMVFCHICAVPCRHCIPCRCPPISIRFLLGGVNHIWACIGVVAGFINVLLILCLLWAVVVITNGNLPFVNDSSLSGSYFYSFFSAYNPFL
ncbi:MAG: hypothetical protein ACLRZH_16000 [Ruthenibacterium lactatiformans]